MAEKDVNDQSNYGKNLAENKTIADRVLNYVKTQVEGVYSNRAYLHKKWTMLERLWRGDPLSRYFRGLNSTHVPEPWKIIESVVPRMKRALFPSDRWYRVIPAREGFGDPKAIRMVLDAQMENGQFWKRVTHFIRYCAIMGTQFAKTPWITDKYSLKVKEPTEKMDLSGSFKEVDVEISDKTVNKSRTEWKNLSIFDFIADPRYQDPMRSPFCSDRTQENKEYVLRMLDEGKYKGITSAQVDELKAPQEVEVESIGKDYKLASQALNNIEKQAVDNYTITDWWGLIDPNDPFHPKKRREFQVVIINGKKSVRIVENGLWHHRRPYLYSQWTEVDGELYGIGLIEIIIRLCMDLNDQASARNMATALITNPMMLVNDEANIPGEKIISIPGGVIRTRADNVTSSVRPLFMIDQTAASQMRSEEIRRDITEATGTPRSQQGGIDEQGGTATAFHGRTVEANVRIKEPAENMARGTLADFLTMMHYNNHQFLDEKVAVQITGQADQLAYYMISPERLAGEARFEVLTAPQIELIGIRGQQMLQTVEAFKPEVLMQFIPNFSMSKFFRIVWTDLFGHKEIDEFAPDPVKQAKLSQEEEIMVMAEYKVSVAVMDWHPHEKHLAIIGQFMLTDKWNSLDPEAQAIINAHAENHVLRVKRAAEYGSLTGPGQMAMGGQPPGPNVPMVGPGMQSGMMLSEAVGGPARGG